MTNPTYDIQTSFRNGQNFNDTDGSLNGSYLAGVNVQPYGDDLIPRYPYKQQQLNIPEGFKNGLSYSSIFSSGNPQAVIPFKRGEVTTLIIIVNGTWYAINPNTLEVSLLEYRNNTQKLSSNILRVNWEIVDRAVVVWDGDLPLIYDGTDIRRADYDAKYTFKDAQGNTVVQAVPEAIRSYLGKYDNLRLWLAIGSNLLAASDEVGSGPPNAPLSFSQCFTDAGDYTGQFPSLTNSTSFEIITAIGNLVVQNPTYTGKLFAATSSKIYLIDSQQLRSDWETTPGFITQILDNIGIDGQLAWKNFGYDLLFTSNGRLNSLYLAQDDLKRWSETDISTEVSNYIVDNNPDLYKYTSLIKYDNLALQTVNPYYTTRTNLQNEKIASVAFKGFTVLSQENQSGLNQSAKPVWAGLWTGVNPMFAVTLGNKMYILSDDLGKNVLYTCENILGNDVVGMREKPIRSRIELGNFKYQDNGVLDKVFKSVDVAIADIKSDLNILIEYKNSAAKRWSKFACKQFKLKNCLESDITCSKDTNNNFLDNYKFTSQEATCEQNFKSRIHNIRFTLEGVWRFRHFRLKADTYPDKDTIDSNVDYTENIEKCSADEVSDFNLYTTFDSEVDTKFKNKFLACSGDCNE